MEHEYSFAEYPQIQSLLKTLNESIQMLLMLYEIPQERKSKK